MAKSVTTIPATLSRFTAAPINSTKKRRVAAYARVSTDNEEQLTSYEAQVDYYTNYIQGRDDWEFAGVYTDEGITGTNTKKREGFKSMVADALAGKIDLIITKSVSRFARNTVDSLTTIRSLKEHNVECYFEKENIWTFDGKGELLLTIMSSLAQEESRSISENCTWGQRKRFADGKVTVPFKRYLPFIATEDLLMGAVKRGGDRQTLHETIRTCSMEAAARMKAEGVLDLSERIAARPEFGMTRAELDALLQPDRYIGRCREQVERFLEQVKPRLAGAGEADAYIPV